MGNDHTAWMPIYWRDLMAETVDMSPAQFGAYCLLVATHWNSRGPLPADPDRLRRIARMNEAEWRKAEPLLSRFFMTANGVWLHESVMSELKKAEARYLSQAERGRRGGLARGKPSFASATAEDPTRPRPSSSSASALPEQAEPQAQESPIGDSRESPPAPTPEDDLEIPAFLDRRTTNNATRLPQAWGPGESGYAFAAGLGIDRQTADNVAAQFRDHWNAKPGRDGLKTDWDGTWRNWLRKHIDFHGSGPWPRHDGGRSGGNTQGRPSLTAARNSILAKAGVVQESRGRDSLLRADSPGWIAGDSAGQRHFGPIIDADERKGVPGPLDGTEGADAAIIRHNG